MQSKSIEHLWDIKAWLKVWVSVITNPLASNYTRLAQEPRVNLIVACIWWAFGMLLANLIGFLLVEVGGVRFSSPLLLPSTDFVWLPVVLIGSLGTLLILAGIIHLIAKLLKGHGTYKQITYLIAAFNFPIMIIVSPLFSVIRGTWIAIISYGYLAFLYIIATKAVYGFSWVRTLITLFLVLVVGEIIFISYFMLLVLPRL